MTVPLDVLNLVDLFAEGRERPTDVMLTTYSADESVLHVLVNAARLTPPKIEFHYELARLSEYQHPVVPRRALRPHAPRGTTTHENRLPVWHPKLWLVRWTGRQVLVVSSANLTPADLRTRGNVAGIVELSARDADRVMRWVRAPSPSRTLLIETSARRPRLITTDRSSWAEFERHLARRGVRREEWLIASPFWSELQVHLGDRPTDDVRLTALGPSRDVLERALHGLDARRLTGLVPARGDFHQKVIAVRQTVRRRTRVVLYVGSGNATTSGFFGRSGRGFNWEAGLVRVGNDDLWKLAQALARVGPTRWKQVSMRTDRAVPLGDLELGPPEEMAEALEAELRTLLFLNLNVGRRSVSLKGRTVGGHLELENVRLLLDAEARALGRKAIHVPDRTQDVVVLAEFVWRHAWRDKPEGTRSPVRLPLPQLLAEPKPEDVALTQAQLLRQLGDPEQVEPSGRARREASEEVTGHPLRDVRFPWDRLASAERRLGRDSLFLRRWLETVTVNPNVPPFWRRTAIALLEGDL